MRPSFVVGILAFGLGLVFSYLADAMITVPAPTMFATFATTLAIVLYVIFSATLLGLGAGLLIHWLLSFSSDIKVFIASMILAGIALFVGIGASIGLVVSNGWTALQTFFTFLTLSVTLFVTSFCSLFFGTIDLFATIKRKLVKKRR